MNLRGHRPLEYSHEGWLGQGSLKFVYSCLLSCKKFYVASHIEVYEIVIQIKHTLLINHKEIYFKTVFDIKIVLPFNKDKSKFLY